MVVIVEQGSGIATITMDDPVRRNALTSTMCQSLCEALRQADLDVSVSLVVIKGKGPSFCAGGDIKAMNTKSDFFAGDSFDIMESYRRTVQQIPLTLVSMRKPTIAVVNGSAVGAGFDLACFCDLRIATTQAKFAESFGSLGLISGIGGAFALSELIGLGYGVAADLALTGRMISGEEAYRLGIVNRLCEPDTLIETENALTEQILSHSQEANVKAKVLLRQARKSSLEDHLILAAALQGTLQTRPDHLTRVGRAVNRTRSV
jgi:enoyl-CoA hydratase/carnithine racemase